MSRSSLVLGVTFPIRPTRPSGTATTAPDFTPARRPAPRRRTQGLPAAAPREMIGAQIHAFVPKRTDASDASRPSRPRRRAFSAAVRSASAQAIFNLATSARRRSFSMSAEPDAKAALTRRTTVRENQFAPFSTG